MIDVASEGASEAALRRAAPGLVFAVIVLVAPAAAAAGGTGGAGAESKTSDVVGKGAKTGPSSCVSGARFCVAKTRGRESSLRLSARAGGIACKCCLRRCAQRDPQKAQRPTAA